ncbi:photosynthetic protein synthase I [Aestuariirhabdus litorea]|uniref:Photosynthetic protein synthase I n=2 Tax=Aestuariirhabdus litorea TaxID=2528527 RepID=A0A3P3VRF8_9GAMM|nr:photosynthetic protein synthase I [Aestuariirhabdus litorea]RWW98704.1 photosynthetic protein synthase I [Endozoicomonadaceae bacterium GTF-13]
MLLFWALAGSVVIPTHAQSISPIEVDKARAELGKRLFFDPRLSGDAAISCASCHLPEHGYAHPAPLAPGYPGNKHFRNAPTLINSALKQSWMHDGRLGTNLNDVTREMITETYLMNMDMRLMQERIKQDPVYVRMFAEAGMGEPSNGGVRNAIPEYLKTLTSRGAPYDSGSMGEAARRGEQLFNGKAGCHQCHTGPLFLDNRAHNTGVPENLDIFLDPQRDQAFIAFNNFMGVENYMNLKRDVGAHVRLHKADKSDVGSFMTPTLRELKYTAPYMHNGMLPTLEEVVAFYNRGGGQDRNKSRLLKPLGLSASEQQDLVEFLLALSGEPLSGAQWVWDQPYPEEYDAIVDWRQQSN